MKVTIPRVPISSSPAAATMQHILSSGSPGATYICRYVGPGFRAVLFEQDCQDTVPDPFTSYNTGSLPSGGPARTLSVVTAFAEAGVQLLSTGVEQRDLDGRGGREQRLERRRAARRDGAALLLLARRAPVGGLAVPRQAARPRHGPLRDHVRPAGQAAAGLRRLLRRHRRHDARTPGGCRPTPASTSSATASTCSTRGRSRSRARRSRTGRGRRRG